MEKVKIWDVATIYRGVTYKKEQSKKNKEEGFEAVLRANNIDQGEFILDELVYVPNHLISDEQYIRSGDIVISMSSGSKNHVGKVALARNDLNCAFGAFCSKIVAKSIYAPYLYYELRDTSFRRYIEAQCKGTNINNIKSDTVLSYTIPCPPLPEQQRIVARIEELFSQLDVGVETLKKTKQQLEVYRQAVLKEAFSSIISYVPLGEISTSRLGKMLDKEKNSGTLREYLRNINVRWFDFDLQDLYQMRIEDEETEKYSIQKGDLVICEGGEPGRCAVWNEEHTIFYQKALHRVRFINGSNPSFYMYYLWYATNTGLLTPYYTGTGIKHLTGQSLVKIKVPKTDLYNQDKIVEEIESRLSVCESIEKTVDITLRQAEAMRQSVLKQAFEGGL